VLQATKAPLQALLTGKTLHVYTENTGVIKNELSDRNCDGALVADCEDQLAAFDERARADVIMALEAKRCLDVAGKSDALVGGERDMVKKTGDKPSAMMPVGTSVFTDGVEWYFARIAWRMNDRFEWTRNIKISQRINVTAAGGWELLARWFAVSFHEAVTTPFEQTGMAVVKWRRVGGQEWELADMFGAGTRSTVTRWRLGADSVIVKFIAAGATQDRATKVAGYFAHERAMLQTLAQVPSIVHAHPTFARVDSVFTALEDCGDSLAHLNIRGAAGQALARIVVNDIWRGALAALKAANLCHFDITEHNITIDVHRTAKLIDLESCTAIGQPTPSIPTATTDVPNRPATATAAFDEQAVCAILKCLWLLEVSSFAKRKSFFNEFATEQVRLQLVSDVARSSEQQSQQ
jgi:hypothetical protein